MQNSNKLNELTAIARDVRRDILKMAHSGQTSHIGSSLSCVEILAALYFYVMKFSADNLNDPHRDRFILSKGHAAMTLYSVLARAGVIGLDELSTYARDGSRLAKHPNRNPLSGVEISTGSLGHGLSIGAGIAKALLINRSPARVFVLLSDGECDEGSVWEAASLAVSMKLNNLVAIVDMNSFQATDRCEKISGPRKIMDIWRGHLWETCVVDGHSFVELINALGLPSESGLPGVVLSHTVKGKGISFMEHNLDWHYKFPSDAELKQALVELR